MRVEAARYRGQDDKGRPFTITAESAVQATSRDPIVDVLGMMARLGLESGPATIRADQGRYNLENDTVTVTRPAHVHAADGYRNKPDTKSTRMNTRHTYAHRLP